MRKKLRRIRHGLAWEHNRELTETVRDSVGYNTKMGMFWAQLRRIGEALRLWAARSLWNEAFAVAMVVLVSLVAWCLSQNAQASARAEEATQEIQTLTPPPATRLPLTEALPGETLEA